MNEAVDKENALVEISDADVLKAMAAMQGYIDITPADFREVYRAAYAHALNRMMTSIKAKDIMSRHVCVVRLEMDLIQTATLLADKSISGAPVVDGQGKVVGVVSEKDFLKNMDVGHTGSFMGVIADCMKNKGCLAAPMRGKTVRDIMTTPPVTAREDISVGDISALFIAKNINRLPIVDQEENPVGIVTRSDLVNSYCLIG
jgi:CBS domain-containing membrane protein